VSSSPIERRPDEATPDQGPGTDAPPLVDLTMPQMGVSVVEGTVAEWKKQAGDRVERDEIICSISTDKIDTDVESPASGRVAELLVEVGATVEVGVVLARIATEDAGQNGSASSAGTSEATVALEAPGDAGELQGDTAVEHDETATESTSLPRNHGPRRYSPVVMRIAAEHRIDLEEIDGTGRGGRVRKPDVLAFLQRGTGARAAEEPPMHIESPYKPERIPPKPPKSAPAPAVAGALGSATSGPLSRMRQAIGGRMLESLQTTATCTTIVECDMSAVQAARARSGFTYLPYVARATVETLGEFPSLNATLEDETFTQYDSVHLGIAVSLGQGGLIVPVIHHAQDLSVEGLAGRIKGLARKARDNELTPDDVRGGTFTITNPGAFGAVLATPVINQPQVAILDCEAVVKRAVVLTDERTGADSIAIRPMTYFCMSWDHRALDGALAAQFLTALRGRLEATI
jgi:pyruvate/2-oxoglutarate dehydrogenase complex dihydrolipoamide acyltransferase (E2) component